jgi:hypothetical protein
MGKGRGRSAAGAQGMGGGVNGSSNLNDGSGPGMSRDCDGVRIGSVSECLEVGSDGVQRSLTFGGCEGVFGAELEVHDPIRPGIWTPANCATACCTIGRIGKKANTVGPSDGWDAEWSNCAAGCGTIGDP